VAPRGEEAEAEEEEEARQLLQIRRRRIHSREGKEEGALQEVK
jgi:hypothetical protein